MSRTLIITFASDPHSEDIESKREKFIKYMEENGATQNNNAPEGSISYSLQTDKHESSIRGELDLGENIRPILIYGEL